MIYGDCDRELEVCGYCGGVCFGECGGEEKEIEAEDYSRREDRLFEAERDFESFFHNISCLD